MVGVAVRLKLSGTKIDSAAVGITGVSHIAYRATAVEDALRGKATSAVEEAANHAADGVDAIGDTFASAEYRKHLASVMTKRTLAEAMGD